jgi:hypothetical protein
VTSSPDLRRDSNKEQSALGNGGVETIGDEADEVPIPTVSLPGPVKIVHAGYLTTCVVLDEAVRRMMRAYRP